MAYDGTLKFNTLIDASGFQDGINTIGSIAEKGLKATGAILAGSATAIGGLGLAALKVGAEFDSAMSKVSAISGAAGNELQQLRDKAIEMGDKTKYSATESANAFEYMAMAGWKTGDMLDGIEGIMNLAAASGEDLATTSDIVTDALTAFKMSAGDATHFADVLAAASSNANTNVGMMGETFKYVAPVAGALGYSAEDCAVAIGLMANSGIKASQAGTTLRQIFSRLAKPTDEVEAAMKKLGISLTDSKGNMKSLDEVMEDLRQGFSGLSEAEAAQMAAALGGQEAMSGLLAMVNASDKDFDELKDSIYHCDGAAAEMAETMNDNLAGQLTILKGQLETFGIVLTDDVQEPMKDVVKEAQNMVSAMKEAYAEDGLGGLVSAVGPVLAEIIQKIADAAPQFIEVAVSLVESFCKGLASAPGIGESGAELITSLISAILFCAEQIWSTAITLIGQFAGGIAAGAPNVVQAAADCITGIIAAAIEWLPTIMDAGIQIIEAIITGIANMLPTLMTQAVTIITTIATKIVENLPTIIECAIQIVESLILGFISAIPQLLEGAVQLFQAIVDALPIIIEKLLAALPSLIISIVDFLVASLPQIINAAVQMLNGIIDAIPTIIQAIVENLPQIITALVNGLVGALPQILEAAIMLLMAIIQAIPEIVVAIAENLPQIISAIATGLGEAIPQIFMAAKELLWQIIEAVPEIVAGLAEAVPDIVTGIANGLKNGVTEVWNAAKELGTGILNGIKDFFGIHSPSTVMAEQGTYLVEGMIQGLASLPEQMTQTLSGALQAVLSWGQNILVTAGNMAISTVNAVVTCFSELPGKIWTWLVETVNKVIQWGINLKNTADTYVSNTINSAVKFFSQLPGKLWTWLVNTVTKIKQWGANMLSSASSAASNTINKVSEWFSQLPGKVWIWLSDTISKVAQFGSDMAAKASSAASEFCSKLVKGLSGLPGQMVTIGSNIVSGIWKGISGGWDWLVGKVKSLADSLFKGVKDALGIESPSKVFAQEVGRWIPPGIGVGIDDTMPDLESQVGDEMDSLAQKMQTAVEVETGNITVRSRTRAQHEADMAYPKGGDTYVEEKFEQHNTYNTPVATPSEVSKSQREAARKLLGGIK